MTYFILIIRSSWEDIVELIFCILFVDPSEGFLFYCSLYLHFRVFKCEVEKLFVYE